MCDKRSPSSKQIVAAISLLILELHLVNGQTTGGSTAVGTTQQSLGPFGYLSYEHFLYAAGASGAILLLVVCCCIYCCCCGPAHLTRADLTRSEVAAGLTPSMVEEGYTPAMAQTGLTPSMVDQGITPSAVEEAQGAQAKKALTRSAVKGMITPSLVGEVIGSQGNNKFQGGGAYGNPMMGGMMMNQGMMGQPMMNPMMGQAMYPGGMYPQMYSPLAAAPPPPSFIDRLLGRKPAAPSGDKTSLPSNVVIPSALQGVAPKNKKRK
ncbi:hypothetical protein HDE_10909 [Halotydeus destructor]|nr:hypothetical protein HDE_10909 [Halotydeus destructor]